MSDPTGNALRANNVVLLQPTRVEPKARATLCFGSRHADNFKFNTAEPIYDDRQDLVMDSADPAGFVASDTDCA